MSARAPGFTFTPGMPFDAYQAIDAWNASAIKQPTLAGCRVARQSDSGETDAMRFGTALHAAVLEPVAYADAEAVAVYGGARRAGEAWATFCRDHAGQTILTAAQDEDVRDLAAIVLATPEAQQFLHAPQPQREVTIRGTCPDSGLPIKARLDLLQLRPQEERDIILDVKTAAAETLEDFGRSCARMRYDWQMAHYRRTYRLATGRDADVWLLAVFKQAPRECVPLAMPRMQLAGAEERVIDRLREIAAATRTGVWPGRAADLTPSREIPWPEWAMDIPDVDMADVAMSDT